jgi:hypothetical protein
VGVTLSFSTVWPVALGALLAGAFWQARRRLGLGSGPRIPEGDILVPLARLLSLPGRLRGTGVPASARWPEPHTGSRYARYFEKLRVVYPTWVENSLRYWVVASLVFLALVLTLTLVNLSA